MLLFLDFESCQNENDIDFQTQIKPATHFNWFFLIKKIVNYKLKGKKFNYINLKIYSFSNLKILFEFFKNGFTKWKSFQVK